MWTIGRNGVMGLAGFAVAGIGVYLADAFLTAGLAVMLAGLAVTVYSAHRASAATPREITIPFTGNELPKPEVKAAFERMGFLVSTESVKAVAGLSSGLGSLQELTVTAEPGHLRVRSCFSDSRVYGGEKNQQIVERFRTEWERRTEAAAAAVDPVVRAAADTKAREDAQTAIWSGGLGVAFGVGVLALTLFVRPANGAAASGQFRLAGIGLLALGYGLPRLLTGVSRLREPPRR